MSGSAVQSIFGKRRNILESKWDIIFSDNEKEWIYFKPALGLTVYPCYACKHMFSSKEMFQDHVNRRAIVLKYNCLFCATVKTFYNRCSFMLHARTHFESEKGVINLSELDIFTLPIGMAGFLPHPTIPVLYDDDECIDKDMYSSTVFYNPDSNEKGNQIIELKAKDLFFNETVNNRLVTLALKQIATNIPKCEFITAEEYNRLKSINKQHNEELNSSSPLLSENDIKEEALSDNFTIPIISKIESLHDDETNKSICLECNEVQRKSMKDHFLGENKPIDEYLKCSVCKFIAPTGCSLKAHLRIHVGTSPFVCPDCGKCFLKWNLLRTHMDDVCYHLAKNGRFRCPGKKCGKLFAMNLTYAAHFSAHFIVLNRCSVCKTMFFDESNMEEHSKIHQDGCEIERIYNCTVCNDEKQLNESQYKEHINWHTTDRNKCTYVYICRHCRSYFRSTGTYAIHIAKCPKFNKSNKKVPYVPFRYVSFRCSICSDQFVHREDNPVEICSKCKKTAQQKPLVEKRKRYLCILCDKELLEHEKNSHISSCKYGYPIVIIPNIDSQKDLLNNSTSTISDDSFIKSDDHAKKKRKRSNVVSNKPKKPEVILDMQADEPIPFDGTYFCKVCNFSSMNREEFHDHIICHRDISTAYQCMECAECFVVKPSLVKHLLHFHNVKDVDAYFSENKCFDKEAVGELVGLVKAANGDYSEPIKENQCKVCREQFSDDLTLKKHFRIHGMAFLMQKNK